MNPSRIIYSESDYVEKWGEQQKVGRISPLFYSDYVLKPPLTWRNPVRVASPHRINLEEPGQGGQPT